MQHNERRKPFCYIMGM